MTKSTKPFIFCVHAHQPVGNFEHVLEEAYQKCYKPFVEVLARHPKCRVVLHLSGSLLDWLKQNQAPFLSNLKQLQDQGTLEILGGAYYEPVFSEIPTHDLMNQIRLMQKNQNQLFGRASKGVWLTERVWTPELLPVLAEAGVEYSVLDDCHFERAGHTTSSGYYRLEQLSDALDLFSSSKNLRYLIPFSQVEDAIAAIQTAADSHDAAAVFADDLEKFGLWPKTAAWVYGQQWLDKFFTAIEKNTNIRMMTFSEARTQLAPQTVPHVPGGSYEEMTDWAGGAFKNFSHKYSESLYMKERAWATSEALSRWGSSPNGHTADLHDAQTSLYKAQCNCSYWHGVFGGLYLHHLRSATFENLIQADQALRKIIDGHGSVTTEAFEKLALPSGIRWVGRQDDLVSFWNGSYGATLEELDHLPSSVNLLCTLKRQMEPYHEVVTKNGSSRLTSGFSIHQLLGVKERGLEKALIYDAHRRLAFMDHFFDGPISVREFEALDYVEAGDFMSAVYDTKMQGNRVIFNRTGQVLGQSIAMSKTVELAGDDHFFVHYHIQNKGSRRLEATWGVEFNFSIGNERAPRVTDTEGVKVMELIDTWRDIPLRIASEGLFRVLVCPIETVSGSEAGLGRTYQGLSLLWQRPLTLEPGEGYHESFDLRVGEFGDHQKEG